MTDHKPRERADEWPRAQTCLYGWCPQHSDECKRCDAVLASFRKMNADEGASLEKTK